MKTDHLLKNSQFPAMSPWQFIALGSGKLCDKTWGTYAGAGG